MQKEEIKHIINETCKILYKENHHLIKEKAHERTIVSCIIPYLQSQFTEYEVVTDYNREGEIEKRLTKTNSEGNPVIPDLIVHQYGPNGINLIVIEVKGYWNYESRNIDEEKLKDFKLKQGYKFAYRIELGKDKAEIIEVNI